jgi:2,3-dihydroxybenzoate decarboxylase
MGEFLPFMRSQLDSRYATLDPQVPLQRLPSAYIGSNVVITTSGVFSPAALEIGAEAVLFSVDYYPHESSHEAVAGLERTTLSDADRTRSPTATLSASCGCDPTPSPNRRGQGGA